MNPGCVKNHSPFTANCIYPFIHFIWVSQFQSGKFKLYIVPSKIPTLQQKCLWHVHSFLLTIPQWKCVTLYRCKHYHCTTLHYTQIWWWLIWCPKSQVILSWCDRSKKITQRETLTVIPTDQTDWNKLTFENVGLHLYKLATKTKKVLTPSFSICKSVFIVCGAAPDFTLLWNISEICFYIFWLQGSFGVMLTSTDWASRRYQNMISVYFSFVAFHLKSSYLLQGYGNGSF